MKWATYLFPHLTYLNNKKKLYSPEIHERIMRYNLLNRFWIFGIWLLYSPILLIVFIFTIIAFLFEKLSVFSDWLSEKFVDLAILLGSHNLEKRRIAWAQTKRAWIKKNERHEETEEEPTGI